jgi:hypothetical protein
VVAGGRAYGSVAVSCFGSACDHHARAAQEAASSSRGTVHVVLHGAEAHLAGVGSCKCRAGCQTDGNCACCTCCPCTRPLLLLAILPGSVDPGDRAASVTNRLVALARKTYACLLSTDSHLLDRAARPRGWAIAEPHGARANGSSWLRPRRRAMVLNVQCNTTVLTPKVITT